MLIADIHPDRKINVIRKEKRPVKFIDSQYHNNTISDAAIKRCINALSEYLVIANENKVTKIITTTTSGIRSAVNRDDIIKMILLETGINVEVIDGQEEARLVYEGVKNAVPINNEMVLIVDIGGGSIEFIICNDKGPIWKNSYNLGVARLLQQFMPQDPLTNENIRDLHAFFDRNLTEVFIAAKELQVVKLIGSSGSFDTFRNLAICADPNHIPFETNSFFEISKQTFLEIYQKLTTYNIFQRLEMKGMEPIRVEMIPVSAVLTDYILQKIDVSYFYQSDYAVKEGLIFDYYDKINKNTLI